MKMVKEKGKVERKVSEYENESSKFRVPIPADYQVQYSRIYRVRLGQLKERLSEAAHNKWGKETPFKRTCDLKHGEECFVVGTVIKHQELRPSILKNIAKQVNELPQPIAGKKYVDGTDKLGFEDDMQLISLHGNINTGDFVTGVTAAFLGQETSGDEFEVKEVLFIPFAPQPKRPTLTDDRYILFVSGLEFTGSEGESGERLISNRLLADWLVGAAGCDDENKDVVSRIARIVIAGNSIAMTPEDRHYSEVVRRLNQRKHLSPGVQQIRNLDMFMARIAPAIPIDLMPGENDPSNFMMPQQPLHHIMFPSVKENGGIGNVNFVTNPYQAKVDGRVLLGTSGQNLDDIYRYSTKGSAIDLLEATFRWHHLCPTAPDTLATYPYHEKDPFIVSAVKGEECPDIFFAGNQKPRFEQKYVEGPNGQKTLLLAIPPFADTGIAVLANLRNLKEAKVIEFGRNTFETWDDIDQ